MSRAKSYMMLCWWLPLIYSAKHNNVPEMALAIPPNRNFSLQTENELHKAVYSRVLLQQACCPQVPARLF